MVKVLFIVGQCVRLLNTDPWQSPTYEIAKVGEYSYRVIERSSLPILNLAWYGSYEYIPFTNQSKFIAVKCPGNR